MSGPMLSDWLKPEQHAAAVAALEAVATKPPQDPVILRVIHGISAWLASCFLLGFVGTMIGAASGEALLVLGTLAMAVAVWMFHRLPASPVFISQLMLALMLCGHAMVMVGMAIALDGKASLLNMTLIQSAITLLGGILYRKSAYHVIAGIVTVGLWIAFSLKSEAAGVYHLLLAVQAIAFGVLVLWWAMPVTMGWTMAVSLTGTVLLLDWMQSHLWVQPLVAPLWPATLVFALLMLATGARMVSPAYWREPRLYLVAVAVLALSWLTTPGILLSMILIILGHALRDRVYIAIGLLGFAAFVVVFYYSLQISLLHKSGLMVVSGTLCLLLALGGRHLIKTLSAGREAGA